MPETPSLREHFVLKPHFKVSIDCPRKVVLRAHAKTIHNTSAFKLYNNSNQKILFILINSTKIKLY